MPGILAQGVRLGSGLGIPHMRSSERANRLGRYGGAMTTEPEHYEPTNHLAYFLDGRILEHLGRHIICQGNDGLRHEGWLTRVGATYHVDRTDPPLLCEAPVSCERVEYTLTLDTDPGRSAILDGVQLRPGVIYGVDLTAPTLAKVLETRRDERISNATPNDPEPPAHWRTGWDSPGDVV